MIIGDGHAYSILAHRSRLRFRRSLRAHGDGFFVWHSGRLLLTLGDGDEEILRAEQSSRLLHALCRREIIAADMSAVRLQEPRHGGVLKIAFQSFLADTSAQERIPAGKSGR